MHIFLDNLHQGGKYSSNLAIQQVELRREEKFIDQNLYPLHIYRLNI